VGCYLATATYGKYTYRLTFIEFTYSKDNKSRTVQKTTVEVLFIKVYCK